MRFSLDIRSRLVYRDHFSYACESVQTTSEHVMPPDGKAEIIKGLYVAEAKPIELVYGVEI